MNAEINSHWIPLFLTRPWEYKKGKFKCFRFSEGRIVDEDSNSLFAAPGLFTQEVEDFFNKHFETPIAHTLSSCAQADGSVKLKKWKVFRAVALFIFHLMERHRIRTGGHTPGNNLSDMDESDLNGIAQTVRSKYEILQLELNPSSRLLFPSTGFFPVISMENNASLCLHFCVPIGATNVLCLTKKGVSEQHITNICQDFTIINSSVGVGCDEVLIHPDLLIDVSEKELISSIIQARKEIEEKNIEVNKFVSTYGELEEFYSIL